MDFAIGELRHPGVGLGHHDGIRGGFGHPITFVDG